MANIFINGLNSKVGGGKSILNNYLSLLKENKSEDIFFVLTPNKKEYIKYETNNITIIDIQNIYKKNIFYPLTNLIILRKLLKENSIDMIFNLADIPIPTKIKQVFLFDWPYAVYPESIVWKKMDKKSLFNRKIKLYFFKRYLKYPTTIIAQTETIKKRLEFIYSLNNIKVIPNAVSLQQINNRKPIDFNLPEGKKLLYLTYYYSHKNLEIFIPLAKEIKRKKLNFKLITTIDRFQHKGAKKFLDDIEKYNLDKIIYNIGPINFEDISVLYKQCDGLLMPTLLETYGLPYIEAMHNQINIFTSNLDFAIDVCKESAFYFNPLDEKSILNSIEKAFDNKILMNQKVTKGNKNLNQLLSWQQVSEKYYTLLTK